MTDLHVIEGECFHCGAPLDQRGVGAPLPTVQVQGVDVTVCCLGCRAAVELVHGLGLGDYYRFRTLTSPKPEPAAVPWAVYDAPELQDSLTQPAPRGRAIVIVVEGMTCAACGWLITRSLTPIPGVIEVSVNTATGRARIVWDGAELKLSQLLGMIASLGYRPHPSAAPGVEAPGRDERRALLKRLAVAGLGMMQVMMFAVAMYAGDAGGMDADVKTYLRLVSMLVATPVMLYGGWPYFIGATTALARRTITMDVSVALGLLLAYVASVVNTWRHAGAVYYDSVTMFIFLLTVARYVEMVARHQSTEITDALGRMLPATAHRLTTDATGDSVEEVTVNRLAVGDRLLVRLGEVVPADGQIVAGCSQFDESLLTGESLPVGRIVGDQVTGGTLNVGAPLQIRVIATGRTTVLARIVALLEHAATQRPSLTTVGDRRSSQFLACVLAGAVCVCVFWCCVDPTRALEATLAVLVVACPCAFSLATLVVVASANTVLARRGVLVTGGDAIEGLCKVTHVVFDKTGTLTDGVVTISRCTALGRATATECLQIAAALEQASEHPIARAFSGIPRAGYEAHDVTIFTGGGVAGTVNGRRLRIGTRAFVNPGGRQPVEPDCDPEDDLIYLACESEMLAAFAAADEPRPESARVTAALLDQGLTCEISSGDSSVAVRRTARHCGIDIHSGRQSPSDKLERVQSLHAAGAFVAVVGDGVNDAPVLGGAGVSIAMSRGSALTLASADIILVGDSLRALPGSFRLAHRAVGIIRQNLLSAAAYNFTAMPLAAMGWVPPWAAAIGMSMSSILVVLNSLRLLHVRGHLVGSDCAAPAVTSAPAFPGVSVAT